MIVFKEDGKVDRQMHYPESVLIDAIDACVTALRYYAEGYGGNGEACHSLRQIGAINRQEPKP